MAAVGRAPVIDSGRIIGRGFRVVGENFVPFTGIAVLLVGLPAVAVQYLSASSVATGTALAWTSPLYWAAIIVPWILTALLQGILVRATILDLADAEMELGQCMVTAFVLVLPIAAISLLVLIGFFVGFVLLIVPGVIFYLAMSVAIPALIEERAGVFGSMARSYRLTRGSWLQIFVLFILYAIFMAFVWMIVAVVFGAEIFGLGLAPDPMMSGVAYGLVSTLSAVIVGIMTASLYIELRTVKEGATTDALASIFA